MLQQHDRGWYIGTIIDPLCLPTYHINEPEFFSAEEEYAGIPIKVNILGWIKHIAITTGE
jgi:hypothetical protein